jgi:hypothetical protein
MRTETDPASETSCFSSNYLESGRWTKSENPVILCHVVQFNSNIGSSSRCLGWYCWRLFCRPHTFCLTYWMVLLTDIFWSIVFQSLLNTFEILRNMWFMHDGAPAHVSYSARNYLETAYTLHWVWRQGLVPWPSRSWIPWLFPLEASKNFDECCSCGHCSGTVAACSEWQYLSSQHFLHFFSASVDLCFVQPKLMYQCKTNILNVYYNLTTFVTACHWNVNLHF